MSSSFFSFGPPNIFQTQADTYSNSFGNPINSANMNSGWGINSNLLTPSYQAPYRPQYSGEQPYNNYGRVGFFGGVNHLFNPTVREPVWGNPVDQAQPSIEGVSGRPFDAAAWMGQRIAGPALAFGGAYRFLGPQSFGGYFTGKGIAAGLGQAMGSSFGRGLATSIGMRGAAGAAGGLFGVAGSVAGGLALPMLAAQGALYAGQKALWNPYINSRRESMDLRRNFSGVNFSDATGNAVTGGGLGYRESNNMASDITRAGIQDMSFSTSEYSNIADFSARAGLMDNVKSKQITQRVKDVAEQIKLIMAISKDPDIKNAIEELSKLNLAGASLTGGRFSVAAGAYQSMGRYAAQAGVSVQRMMNTAGAQGQYLFQANGMTPYLGQMAASNVYAGFSAAQRVGMMSPAQLARMGGVEGATQASLTGMMNAAQTPYNQMALYNQYIGGAGGSAISGSGQNLMNVVTTFGASAARDPLKTMGGLTLYGNQMAGKQLAGQGSASVENQMVSLMDTLGTRKNANGKYDAESMVPFLQQAGMSREEIIAFISQRAGESDPRVAQQRIKGIDRFTAEQMRQTISQDFAYDGYVGRAARGVAKFGRNVVSGISDALVSPVLSASGSVGDAAQSFTDWVQFGSTIGDGLKVSDVSTLFQKAGRTGAVSQIHPTMSQAFGLNGGLSGRSDKVIKTINQMAREGHPDAVAFLSIKDPAQQRSALGSLIRKNKDRFGDAGNEVLSNDNPQYFQELLGSINGAARGSFTPDGSASSADRVTKAFKDTIGGDASLSDSMQAIGSAYDIEKKLTSGSIGADNIDQLLQDPRYASLKKLAGDRTGSDAISYINGIFKRGAANGTIGISNDAFTAGATLEAYKKSNGSQISDKGRRDRFLSAKTDTERNQIVLEDQASRRGGSVLDQTVNNEDPSEVMKIIDPMINGDKQKRALLDAVKSGRVDFTTAMQTINALDSQESDKKFSDAVGRFDEAVKRMEKGPGSSSGGGGGFLSWLTKGPDSIEEMQKVIAAKGAKK